MEPHEHHHHCHCGADIHVTVHDGAVAASFEKTLEAECASMEERIQMQMHRLAHHLRSHGAIIGHIKCVLLSGGTTIALSLTSRAINRTVQGTGTAKNVTLYFAAIALNVEKEEMEELLHGIYHGLENREEKHDCHR